MVAREASFASVLGPEPQRRVAGRDRYPDPVVSWQARWWDGTSRGSRPRLAHPRREGATQSRQLDRFFRSYRRVLGVAASECCGGVSIQLKADTRGPWVRVVIVEELVEQRVCVRPNVVVEHSVQPGGATTWRPTVRHGHPSLPWQERMIHLDRGSL